MRKKDHSNLAIFILLCLLLFILCYPTFIMKEVKDALITFITKYFPAVFPLYIITDLLIYYEFPEKLSRHLKTKTEKLLHCDGSCAFVILMSLFSGFPSGAKYTKDLWERKIISEEAANFLITFTHFSNPLFILGTCFLITKNQTLTLLILLCHFGANFLLAFFVRPKKQISSKNLFISKEKTSVMDALTTSIFQTFRLMFLILGTSILFFILSGILTFFLKENPHTYFITGFLELTKGIINIPKNINPLGQGIIILTFLSFGSFSIHMQVLSIIKNTPIRYQNFFLGRICQTAISITLFLLLTKIIIL